MKILASLITFGVCLVQGASLSSLQQIGPDAVQVSRYIGSSHYPRYYIYNYLQVDHARELPIAIFSDGRPAVPNVQPTYAFYGTPVYDYRYHFNQIFPGLPGNQPPTLIPSGEPSFVPSQGPSVQPPTQRPPYEDDGIEKLDEKLDPDSEGKDEPHREDNSEDDDDTVTIDAI